MGAVVPTILATSMGLNRAREPWVPGPVFAYGFSLARVRDVPRLCLLATAGGDQTDTVRRFREAFAGTGIDVSHLALFDAPNVSDVRGHLLSQDMIWVDRGSLVNLLAVWRAHDLDEILRECWQAGVVLGGESAGSLCWHVGGTTDSFGQVRAVRDGLGFLPYSNAVHYAQRRAQYLDLVASGELPEGYATDAGAGLRYAGTDLAEVIADRPDAAAYRVSRGGDGQVGEERLEARRLRR